MKLCCFDDLHYSGFKEWFREMLENTIDCTCSKCCNVVIITGDMMRVGVILNKLQQSSTTNVKNILLTV